MTTFLQIKCFIFSYDHEHDVRKLVRVEILVDLQPLSVRNTNKVLRPNLVTKSLNSIDTTYWYVRSKGSSLD